MILCILAEGERSVSELEDLWNLRQPTVSQQLARLRADGLVSTRRDGKTIYYNLASEEARIVIGATLRRVLPKDTQALAGPTAMEGARLSCLLPNRRASRSTRERQNQIAPVRHQTPGVPRGPHASPCASPQDKPQPETLLAGKSPPRAACVVPRVQGASARPLAGSQALL